MQIAKWSPGQRPKARVAIGHWSSVIGHRAPPGARGFTLIELLIVIAIVGLLMGFTYSFVGQARRGQRRFQCVSQLQQIYAALRQYQLDELGYPPYDVLQAQDFASDNISEPPPGLYALVGTRDLVSVGRLHCSQGQQVQVLTGTGVAIRSVGGFQSVEKSYYYNSYQNYDAAVGLWQYQPFRGITDPTDPHYRLQLWPNALGIGQQRWTPLDSTIMTWCPFHREGGGGTLVLYLDGSIRIKNEFVDAGANAAFYSRDDP